ncbi:MAG TPA: class I SAM-dependent methyltransferase [Pyrinomonadaceae bacterium]|nr:class I SAM-dependent methyltransferase [Pyrinomonadaceae bacterium]
MATVREHYDNLLADVYGWMSGEKESVLERNAEFFKSQKIAPQTTKYAVDLGAGNGFQAIPLARSGFSVLAIDLSAKLLQELERQAGNLDVRIIEDDLLNFSSYCDNAPELIVCIGDTLTHLESVEKVSELIKKVSEKLVRGGKFILSFRDYFSTELRGNQRFIPVRSDEDKIFTCFLEYEAETICVHDLLYTRRENKWEFAVSSYRKLRLDPNWIKDELEQANLEIIFESSNSGMIYLIAQKQ